MMIFRKLRLFQEILVFLFKKKFKRTYDVMFFSDGAMDEQWIRSTVFESQKNNTNFIVIICDKKKNHQISDLYIKNGINFFFIKNKTFLKFIKAKIVVTATSCIDRSNFHHSVKRFIYMPHSLASLHSVYPAALVDCFDGIFACGPHHSKEFKAMKESKQQDVETYNVGYGKLDLLQRKNVSSPTVLLAPSWGYYNFPEVFSVDFLHSILSEKYRLVFRPHPMILNNEKEYIEFLREDPSIILDTNFSNNTNLEEASVLITDHSGISMEFMAIHKKPVIFLDLPKKIINADFEKYEMIPMESLVRTMYPNILLDYLEGSVLKSNILEMLSSNALHSNNNIEQFLFNQNKVGAVASKFITELVKK